MTQEIKHTPLATKQYLGKLQFSESLFFEFCEASKYAVDDCYEKHVAAQWHPFWTSERKAELDRDYIRAQAAIVKAEGK